MAKIPLNTEFYSGRTKPRQPQQSPVYSEGRDGLLGQKVTSQTSPLYGQPQAAEDRPSGSLGDVKPGSWLNGQGERYSCFDPTSKRLKGGR